MTYSEATEYLFSAAPLFQNIGAGAYKEGLSNTRTLDAHFGHPHQKYRTIHVGGTNGKGSVCSTLAAILQAQGYKVGLYTSPHLTDFRERIRVNGEMIPMERVTRFVEEERAFFEPLHPSFFELATALAFQYFAEAQVDVAVIEVGLGGRLDCTNIIQPDLSIITNISFDHTQFLGDTLEKIASEKAGIIKAGVPAIIGESGGESVADVFCEKAKQVGTTVLFADKTEELLSWQMTTPVSSHCNHYKTLHFGEIDGFLGGLCQEKNTQTILTAVKMLRSRGYDIGDEAVRKGFWQVCALTGLAGRWQVIRQDPLTICDTAHNTGGIRYVLQHLESLPHWHLHMVLGMVGDKDIEGVLKMLPREETTYYFTQASVRRAMPADVLTAKAATLGIQGKAYQDVKQAFASANKNALHDDIIYVGGSTFVVADMLKNMF